MEMESRTKKSIKLIHTLALSTLLVSACSSSGTDNTNTQQPVDSDSVAGLTSLEASVDLLNPVSEGNVSQPISQNSSVETTTEDELSNLELQSDLTDLGMDENLGNLSDQEQEPETVLNANNATAVILQAFEVFSGKAYDRRLTAYPYVIQAPRNPPAVNALGDHFYYDVLDCGGSGEKSELVYEDMPGFDGFTFYDTTYSNCSVNSEVLNGRAVLSGDTCCGYGYQKEFSNDFSVTIDK